MEITIRKATLKDVIFITELSNQLGYQSLINDTEFRLKQIIAKKDHCVFVAESHNKIVGWIHGFYAYHIESDFFVEIGGLVVDKNFRKNGIGKKLVNYITTWSANKNCKKVRVRCNVLRKESQLFYKNSGFKSVKKQQIFDKHIH